MEEAKQFSLLVWNIHVVSLAELAVILHLEVVPFVSGLF